jgi:hypothetical protein
MLQYLIFLESHKTTTVLINQKKNETLTFNSGFQIRHRSGTDQTRGATDATDEAAPPRNESNPAAAPPC